MNAMLVLDGNRCGVAGSMVENIDVSLDIASLDAAIDARLTDGENIVDLVAAIPPVQESCLAESSPGRSTKVCKPM
jgi:hypothetical protein